ncbi:MAG: rhodanese-like domain-containing protein [Gammaproteobacteria bacterium]|jgi:rhodanese-related sulfurtransferase|nr:rhodanese-like domain-containing protein [Gammaproteobacteria bacterium]
MEQYIEFAGNHPYLHMGLAVVIGMIVWSYVGNRFSGYQRIDPQAAVPLLNKEGAVFLDVRETKEFKEGHVVGAVHIPLNTLPKRHVELNKYQDKPIIVACRSGARSSPACGTLRKAGFEKVYMMNGGMLAWESANLPVTRKK